MKLMALAAPFLLASSAAIAHEPDDVNCDDANTQTEMNICAGREYEKELDALNGMIERRASGLDKVPAGKLRDAQTAWMSFIEAHCEFVGSAEAEGGSLKPTVVGICLADEARKRHEDLKSSFDNWSDR